MTHVRTSPYYPQSNGKLDRWHHSFKSEGFRPGVSLTLDDGLRVAARYITYYNTELLHSAIRYVTPQTRFEGRQQQLFDARDVKLEAARAHRARLRHHHLNPLHATT